MAVGAAEGDGAAGILRTADGVGAVTDSPLEVIGLAQACSVGGIAA